MTYTGEQLEVTAQLDRARATLGEALGQTQDITSSGLDVDNVSASLAGAVKNIFSVQSAGIMDPGSPAAILGAMDYLRNTLELLQEVQSDSPALETMTSTIARILALLYPVAKIFEMIAQKPEETKEEGPILLTSEKPIDLTAPSEEPIPLVEGRESKVTSGAERRTQDRRMVQVDIGIHSNTNFFTGFSQDISTGGIFIATFDILGMGERLNVNFTVPGGPVISVNGVVRWVREYNETTPDVEPGMGVQFEDLEVDDKSAIDKFMEQNPPIFFDDE